MRLLGDTTRARLFFSDGRIDHYSTDQLAYAVWLAAPRGVRVAFRGAGDEKPVYSWDFADKL